MIKNKLITILNIKMKQKLLLVAALFVSALSFAQKDELKAAKKALKNNDAQAILDALEPVQGTIDSADEKSRVAYYEYLGDAYAILAKAGDDTQFENAIKAYQHVESAEVAQKLQGISADLVNSAVADNQVEKFIDAASKLYLSYSISPKDTIFLYYAASSAVSGKDYPLALKYYNELKDINYDGSEMEHTAVDVASGERVKMDKAQRDIMVKAGTHKDPQDKRTESKRSEIIKNIALIYTQEGDDAKAMEAYVEARKVNPNDVSLILNQANLYFKQGDKDKFKSLMNEAIEVDPQNPDLHYNIGVISMEQNDYEGARVAYGKTIEIDPTYINAHLNLSTSYINEGNSIVEQMNAIRGNSAKELAKYDTLKEKKESLFKKGAEALEAAASANPGNKEILEQLKNIYGALSDFVNYKRVQDLIDQ